MNNFYMCIFKTTPSIERKKPRKYPTISLSDFKTFVRTWNFQESLMARSIYTYMSIYMRSLKFWKISSCSISPLESPNLSISLECTPFALFKGKITNFEIFYNVRINVLPIRNIPIWQSYQHMGKNRSYSCIFLSFK